jgi:DNA-binding response OmpR family regulator
MVILLIDGNSLAADFVKDGLSAKGFQVEIAHDGLAGRRLFETRNYDLVILDVVLPHLDGLALCRLFRQQRVDLPILILSSRGDTPDKVAGLESGADDYLLKPFHFDELLARIHALLRRKTPPAGGGSFRAGDLEVDIYKRTVVRGGRAIQLTSTEFSLLALLIEHKDMVLSRTFISASIWGIDFERRTNLITVYINYLRSKIDKAREIPLIFTIVHEGYMLKDPDTP